MTARTQTTVINLTTDQFTTLTNALVNGYERGELRELVRKQGKQLRTIVSDEVNDLAAVQAVIGAAQRRHWLLPLVATASEELPHNKSLRLLYEDLLAVEDEISMRGGNVNPYELQILDRNRSIVDRRDLRHALQRLIEVKYDSHILVVDGKRKSGKSYTVELIFSVKNRLDTFRNLAWIDLATFPQKKGRGITAMDIAQDIVDQWGLSGMPKPPQRGWLSIRLPIITNPSNVQEDTWIEEFCNWLKRELESSVHDEWVIIIDHVKDAPFKPGGKAHDLLLGMARQIYARLTMVRLILLDYPYIDELQDQVPGGKIEYECIPEIDEDAVWEFFENEYMRRKEQQNIPFSEDDVMESVIRVWEKVSVWQEANPDSELRLEYLGRTVAAEATRLAEQGNRQ